MLMRRSMNGELCFTSGLSYFYDIFSIDFYSFSSFYFANLELYPSLLLSKGAYASVFFPEIDCLFKFVFEFSLAEIYY